MNLYILEIKAHEAGHYTQELNEFCKHIKSFFNSIKILTAFGFKDKWMPIENCEIISLCSDKSYNKYTYFSFTKKLYNYQWEFYKSAVEIISKFPSNENVIHIWDVWSVFPIWYFLTPLKNLKIINLKSVHRKQMNVMGSKNIGLIQGQISKILLRRIANKYIAHTAGIVDEAVGIGIEKNKIVKVGIGIENAGLLFSKSEAREKLNLPPNLFLVLFFGVIREEKGIYELFNHIKNVSLEFKLFIVGENRLNKSLTEISKDYGIEEKVIIESRYIWDDEIEKYFRASDAVIICHKKGFKGESGVLLKAIQYQIPVITNLGSNSARIVKEEGIGSVFSLLKPGSITDAISYIMTNQDIIDKNLELSRKKFSWDQMIPEYRSIYFSN